MAKFKLKEETIKVRDMEVTVRELTQSQRSAFVAQQSTGDKYKGPGALAALGTIDPVMTAEEWEQEPADVVEEIVGHIMELSGMTKKGVPAEKEPDAG